MGLSIRGIVPRKEISFQDLKGKTLAVDASNVIYQFLSSIRQPDGTPLQDSKGNITSHLSGLFYRNINLLLEGIKLVYVFDGEMPDLKRKTADIRRGNRDKMREKYEKAKKREDTEDMGKYARGLTRLNDEMIKESKELLTAMGILCVQAPGEGEAQAAFLAQKKEIFAVASQDYDSLAFGAPRLIQNLTLARKRKTTGGIINISPELIELEKLLNSLQINREQLICLAILAGTDYNPKGIEGVGQKRALSLVKSFKYPTTIFKQVEEKIKEQEESFDWQEIFKEFKEPNVVDAEIKFPKINEEKIREILSKHEFSEKRIENGLERLRKERESRKQQTLF